MGQRPGREWEASAIEVGKLVDALIAAIVETAARPTLFEVIASTACALLLLGLTSLAIEYVRLWKRHAQTEAELIERTVGKQSTNWANTAHNLERKARDPGDVARSTAMTHLHMLDEAANAWLKGSQWQEALRVTQEFLRECCHAIGKPSIHEDDFRAAADLIELRLGAYPDLSKAANEATENALRFLKSLDQALAVSSNSPRIDQLREHVDAARKAIENFGDKRSSGKKSGEKTKAA
jgi:hypothetical protein